MAAVLNEVIDWLKAFVVTAAGSSFVTVTGVTTSLYISRMSPSESKVLILVKVAVSSVLGALMKLPTLKVITVPDATIPLVYFIETLTPVLELIFEQVIANTFDTVEHVRAVVASLMVLGNVN